MWYRLATLILLIIVAVVNQTVSASAINAVDSVTISGITHTDESIIRRYIAIQPGETLQMDQLELTRQRLDALGISSSTVVTYTHTPRGYQVLIRPNDSKGFVLEPIKFTSDSIINLMLGNIKVMYHNLKGKAINPYVIYNLSGNKLTLGVQTPGIRWPVYYDIGYYIEQDTYPVRNIEHELEKNETYLRASTIPAPGWKPSIEVAFQQREISDSESLSQQDWHTYRFVIPYTKKTSNLEYEINLLYSTGTESSGTSFDKKAGKYDITYKKNRKSVTLRGILGRTTSSTPVDELFYLGGEDFQRGYESRSFAGSSIANGAIELGYELVPDSIQLKLFAEAGWIGFDRRELFSNERIGSVGVAIDWPSPNGLLSMFVATPSDQWQPRFSLSFQI